VAGRRVADVGVGPGQERFGDAVGCLAAELLVPALEEPERSREGDFAMVPVDRVAGDAAQDGVHEPGGLRVPGLFHQLDALPHGGVRGDAIHIAELVDADAEGAAHQRVELLRVALAEMSDQKVELRETPEGSEYDLGGKPGVAGVEAGRGGGEDLGRPSAALDAPEHIEGKPASRRDHAPIVTRPRKNPGQRSLPPLSRVRDILPVPMTEPLNPPQIQLTTSPEYRENYANSVQLRANLWDFFLLFGILNQAAPEAVSIQNFQGIYLSPQQAKALSNVLQQNLQQYEKTFGEIRLEPQAQSTIQ
jgi:hypothetical protein